MSGKKKKILIVDLDPSRNASDRVCEDDERELTIAELFEDPLLDPHDAIYSGSDRFPNIDVLAGSERLDFVDQLISNRKNPDLILSRILRRLVGEYAACIIDCPPSRGTLVCNALAAADCFITPYGIDDSAITGILSTTALLDELIAEEVIDKRPVNLGAFCTAYEKGNSRATKDLNEIAKENLKKLVLGIRIPASAHAKEAIMHSSTLQFDRKHKVCKAYHQLSTHVVAKMRMKGFSHAQV